jgi:hypothetical protein
MAVYCFSGGVATVAMTVLSPLEGQVQDDVFKKVEAAWKSATTRIAAGMDLNGLPESEHKLITEYALKTKSDGGFMKIGDADSGSVIVYVNQASKSVAAYREIQIQKNGTFTLSPSKRAGYHLDGNSPLWDSPTEDRNGAVFGRAETVARNLADEAKREAAAAKGGKL